MHSNLECPLRKAQYCGICALYGQSPRSCPDTEIYPYRQPQFLEQLIAPSLLEEFKITTATPLAACERSHPEFPATLIVLDNDRAIREVLRKNNLKPKGRVKANRQLIESLAVANGMRLIFKKSAVDQNEDEIQED
jgi:hypothetical protein